MKQFIVCLLLGALFGVTPPPVSAQQNQSPQHSALEIEALKKRVAVLEEQLQIVENVEKLELQAKLADANAKLLNAEFGKLERDLRDSNDGWLIKWGIFALTFLAVGGAGALAWVKSRTNQLIADAVEKNLNGFKDSLNELGILKNQLQVLEKEHAASTLESITHSIFSDEHPHPEQIKALREEALLAVFEDEKYLLAVRYRAAEVLAISKKSPLLVSPVLEFLNSVVDSDLDIEREEMRDVSDLANLFAYIHTEESYEGLTKFLTRLLTENPKHKELFVTETAFSLAMVSLKLNLGNSVSMLKLAIPQLDIGQDNQQALKNLARQFDIFNESEGIKEMLTTHGQSLPSEVVDTCLELLRKHDTEFVENWRAQNTTDNAQS